MEDTLIDIANYKGWKYINISGQEVKNYFETILARIKLSDVLLVVDKIRTKPQSQISPQIISEIYTGELVILKKVKLNKNYAWVKENCIDVARTKIRELHSELIINGYKIDSWVEYSNLGTLLSELNGIIAKYQVNYNFPS